jgi:hypothetical protein
MSHQYADLKRQISALIVQNERLGVNWTQEIKQLTLVIESIFQQYRDDIKNAKNQTRVPLPGQER